MGTKRGATKRSGAPTKRDATKHFVTKTKTKTKMKHFVTKGYG